MKSAFPVLLAASLLAACTAAGPGYDYREAHPLSVERQIVVMPLAFTPGADPFDGEAGERFARMIAGYMDRGSGRLTVVAARRGSDQRTAEQRAALVVTHAEGMGVPRSQIEVRIADTAPAVPDSPAAPVVLRYERFLVQLPECGDFSRDTGRDPSNNPPPNFGCATQRNLGLMVADPGDLVRMRPADPSDPIARGRAVQRYREGKTTASETPTAQGGSVSTVATQQ